MSRLFDSFADELKKQAGIGTFLLKSVPEAFKSVQTAAKAIGLTAENAGKVRLLTGGLGAVGGAAKGYTSTDNPDYKARNAIIGGVLGGAAGGFAGNFLAKKAPVFGNKYAPYFKGIGTHINSGKGRTLDYLSKNWTEKFAPATASAPKVKNFFGIGSEVSAADRVVKNPPMGIKAVGELANNINILKNEGLGGIATVVKNDINKNKFFDKEIKGRTYRFKRSFPGRVINPLLGTGAGMGAFELTDSTNADGSKRSVPNRLVRGVAQTGLWSMAPHLMMGKAMAYDVPKSFIKSRNPNSGQI